MCKRAIYIIINPRLPKAWVGSCIPKKRIHNVVLFDFTTSQISNCYIFSRLSAIAFAFIAFLKLRKESISLAFIYIS